MAQKLLPGWFNQFRVFWGSGNLNFDIPILHHLHLHRRHFTSLIPVLNYQQFQLYQNVVYDPFNWCNNPSATICEWGIRQTWWATPQIRTRTRSAKMAQSNHQYLARSRDLLQFHRGRCKRCNLWCTSWLTFLPSLKALCKICWYSPFVSGFSPLRMWNQSSLGRIIWRDVLVQGLANDDKLSN